MQHIVEQTLHELLYATYSDVNRYRNY